MRTRKLRLISALLAVAMMFVMVPAGAVTAFADSAEKTDEATKLKYTVDANNEVTITGYAGTDTSITIPKKIDGKPVVAIGTKPGSGSAIDEKKGAFQENPTLKRVQIDADLTKIDSKAFLECKNLEVCNIPTTVQEIGQWAFYWCNNLTSITIPGNVERIGTEAFAYDQKLKDVTIQEGVKTIGEGAFAYTDVAQITIPASVETIEERAFAGYGGRFNPLTTITFMGTPTTIGKNAVNCTDLNTINHNTTKAEWAKVTIDNAEKGNQILVGTSRHHFVREITFNLNGHGGDTAPKPRRVPYNKSGISDGIPTPEDSDYKFVGWYATQSDATAANNKTYNFANVDDDVTLYAGWKEKATLSQADFNVKVGETPLGGDVVPKFTYDDDGSAKTATASGIYNGTNISSGDITVKYYELDENGNLKDSTGTTTAPSKVGHYVVKLDVAMSNDYKEAKDVDGGWKFDIVPRDLTDAETGFTVRVDKETLDGTKNVQVKYTGSEVEATAKPADGSTLTEGQYEIEYYDETGTKKLTENPKEPGKYVVKIRVKATENTNEKLVTNDNWKFEIIKADLDEDALGFVVKVAGEELTQTSNVKVTYTGNTVEADVNNTAGLVKDTNYTVEYYKDGSTTPETDLPKEPGKYVVKIRVAATSTTNEKLIEKDYWQFEIVKKSLDENDFELIGDKKWTEGDEGKNATVDRTEDAKNKGVGAVTEVKYYPVNDDGTLGEGSKTLPTKPGKYQVGITVADSDHFEGGNLTSDKWQFEIEKKNETPAPNPDDDAQKKVTITVADGELYVNGEKKPDGTAEVAEGDTVRIELPEEKKTQGELVFGGWVLGQEELLDDLKANGFTPGAANTEFTMPALPEGTQLTIRAQYVTPEQAGQSDDFISTAAAVVGGAALTGLVAWQGYNIFAEVYMKQFLPVLPQNRQELALALWQDAEKPAAVESALYTDVDEDNTDAQIAARWAVENELLKPADKDDENIFKPYKAVSVGQVYRAWNKAQKLKQQ